MELSDRTFAERSVVRERQLIRHVKPIMTINCNLTESDYRAFRRYVMFRLRKMHWLLGESAQNDVGSMPVIIGVGENDGRPRLGDVSARKGGDDNIPGSQRSADSRPPDR